MKKILLVEDDVTVRENTAELLELSDYRVITASNGKLGVQKAKENLPDIIVCDIMMPELDGYGVLSQLAENEKTNQIPFIFLSAKTERKDVRKGMNLGADDYLTKPFEEEELLSAIESRLAKIEILKQNKAQIDSENELHNLDTLRDWMKKSQLQIFKPGQTIYEEGKTALSFYLVHRGVVKAHKYDAKGKEMITEIYKEGDFFGNLSFNHHISYSEYATAVEESRLYSISKDDFHQLLRNNSNIGIELVETMNQQLAEVKEQLLEIAYASVRRKTAKTILRFAHEIQKNPVHSIRISRSDLAGVAGVASETLIRTLSDFKKEGLIEIEGRNVKILDAEKLAQIK